MYLLRRAAHAALTSFLPVFAAITLIPYASWADINVTSNAKESISLTDSSELNSALGGLSTGNSSNTKENNLNALQGNIESLNTQINNQQRALSGISSSDANYARTKNKIAQLTAISTALQRITARLQDGYTITDYTTSTDASTLATTVTLTFSSKKTGNVPLTTYIPSLSSDTDDSEDSDSNSSETDGSDMLTQILQQFGSQFSGSQGSASGQNPLANIQNTLNSIVSGNSMPLTPEAVANAITQAATSQGTTCGGEGAETGEATNNGVATYDIAAGKVYMPNGEVLEAHSGMGMMKDNPSYANQIMRGPTPPNTYTLSMRPSLYYGVAAISMTPTDTSTMYGRNGILAHTKLVRGANDGSHGCVAFADYDKFLNAFRSGQVKTMVVVPSASGKENACHPPKYNTPNPSPNS